MAYIMYLEDALFLSYVAFFVGFLLGIGICYYFYMVYGFSNRKDFKRYYQEITDAEKDEIRKELEVVEEKLELLARRTNTKLFKRYYNSYVKLKSYLKEKWVVF